ncbi:MAG: FecR domain-containing protein [Nitrospinota bacterium]|nr:FecR domain-containing protein [Nitrospinota bacterium]
MKGIGISGPSTLLMAFAILLIPAIGQAAPMAAKAVRVTGGVSYISFQDRGEYDVKVGTGMAEGDRIKTGPGGFVEIRFDNGNRIQLSENTDMTIRSSRMESGGGFTSVFGLALGKVRSLVSRFSPGSSKFEYHTKTAVAGVAGTDFVTEVPEPDITTVAVLPPGMEDEDNPMNMQGSAICGRPELQGKSKVYVQGRDDSQTMIHLTSCLMTIVGDRRAPAQPTIIPDDMLFKIRNTFQPAPPVAASTDLMIANLGKQVSMPLASQKMNSLLHNLDSTLVHGGKAGMTSGSPAGGGVVTGTVVITIK